MTEQEPIYRGKAKSVFRSENPDELIVKFRDDITAFDGAKKDELSSKGVYNARVSAYLFRYLEENGIKSHFVRMEDERTMIVRPLEMIPVEVIVRNIAAGSLVRNYPFEEGAPLNPPVIVLDYKDDERHDPMINDEIIVALGFMTVEEIEAVKQTALKINSLLKARVDAIGLDLVDFKLEFGRHGGEVLLGDEISMDSMRLWDKQTHASMDKDVYRFDKGDVMATYAEVAKRLVEEE
ncbi:phosphoribosylaminoimidazolesuccinocarboxamide synthase [Methanofollis aquaemaris]|uniref:Phosphoribosylaminoimidazole-succinocarboxamide synthase n=1 Tax=Methanofollis aquaemaris TaxID=126734 RepID=A0A8A3S7Q8_9EURY|nr:phosphoribosylaminoimidazolesuccinocarboxamide synthase [Methanofollis aquaemaris]QSZ67714.1 phosphoribosylaminoimidazolesuccinocarboxamide synthase [Methanofollis aquaemaris]